jgi:hypothetical protein
VVNQRSCQQKKLFDKLIWFFAMMTMFCGTIMLIITFLRSVKSGYSPMNHEHYIKFHQFFKSLIVVFRFPAAMLGCLN